LPRLTQALRNNPHQVRIIELSHSLSSQYLILLECAGSMQRDMCMHTCMNTTNLIHLGQATAKSKFCAAHLVAGLPADAAHPIRTTHAGIGDHCRPTRIALLPASIASYLPCVGWFALWPRPLQSAPSGVVSGVARPPPRGSTGEWVDSNSNQPGNAPLSTRCTRILAVGSRGEYTRGIDRLQSHGRVLPSTSWDSSTLACGQILGSDQGNLTK
jgi:hypothetical protein